MRIVIMADGKGSRWRNHMGVPKHLAEIKGEKLICRTIRQLREVFKNSAEIIVTSHDKSYEFEGSRRYEPLNNVLEIDRFTEELIIDDMCFLYGDTHYTKKSIEIILKDVPGDIVFYGNKKSIVAVRIKNSEVFKKHKAIVRELYLEGKIEKCKGWQVYQSFTGQNMSASPVIGKNFVYVDELTRDFNTAEEYGELIDKI